MHHRDLELDQTDVDIDTYDVTDDDCLFGLVVLLVLGAIFLYSLVSLIVY